MSKRIYLAAPIHKEHDSKVNAELLKGLRANGYDVWSPQEAGIASEIAKKTGRALDDVRAEFLKKDLSAMKTCDICLAYIDRDEGMSEGMLWEMGWFTGMNRLVLWFNPRNIKTTLMVQFTADFICREFAELLEVLKSV